MSALTETITLSATIWAAAVVACTPSTWNRAVSNEFIRQIAFCGGQGMGFVLKIAAVLGISLVPQVQKLLSTVNDPTLFGTLVIKGFMRETLPVVVNLLVVGQSGIPMTAFLWHIRSKGDIRALDCQGIDVLCFLIMPRILAMSVSVFGLSVLFLVASLFCGYIAGVLFSVHSVPPLQFAFNVLSPLSGLDLLGFFLKTIIPGMVTGAICCIEGLRYGQTATDAADATKSALVKSVWNVFLISTVISLLAYL
ncbi:ABC transporter permease [Desulfovibrio inopinatus]|uniref:ABC transporter permease n=1 Tax=Desulfovibrio inopinatus TaxID=102109 RepID=UPI0004156BFB|nr:ABC transporter permease [Desulfovibrio inopinatus]